MDVLHDLQYLVILLVDANIICYDSTIDPTKLFMLHYLFVNKLFSVYLNPGRQYNL